MRLLRVLTLTVAALVVSAPCVTDAGSPLGMGQGHAFRGPSNSISTFPTSPRTHHRFDRSPFGGAAVIPWDPYDAVMPAVPAEVPVIVRNVPPPDPPVADPKFVFPPAPSAPEPAGSHTVIVQRGSRIEVQSFPPAR
jgi:hypothetical protein